MARPHYSRPFRTFAEIWEWPPSLPSVESMNHLSGGGLPGGGVDFRLPEEVWRDLAVLFGNPRSPWTPHDIRAFVEEAIGTYLAWAPDGRRVSRLNRRNVKTRGQGIARAARCLSDALTAAPSGAQRAELMYLRWRLAETGSGSCVDWDALLPVLDAVAKAADDACLSLPRAKSGPPEDDAFEDLVAHLALNYERSTGHWPTMYRNRSAYERARNPWDYDGRFANILWQVIETVPALKRRCRGLGDLAARHLRFAGRIHAAQRDGRPVAPILWQRKSRSRRN